MEIREIDRTELKGGGYLVTPDGSGPHPGVVVIHEAYGLNDNIKDICGRFAAEGYVALAVDLFTDRNRAVCMARYMTGMLLGSVGCFLVVESRAHAAAREAKPMARIAAPKYGRCTPLRPWIQTRWRRAVGRGSPGSRWRGGPSG